MGIFVFFRESASVVGCALFNAACSSKGNPENTNFGFKFSVPTCSCGNLFGEAMLTGSNLGYGCGLQVCVALVVVPQCTSRIDAHSMSSAMTRRKKREVKDD